MAKRGRGGVFFYTSRNIYFCSTEQPSQNYELTMTYDLELMGDVWPYMAHYVRYALADCKDKPCRVHIDSPGGDVATALKIRQAFKDHGDVTVFISGMTASAATIIAMGAKKVEMSKNALFLIHNASYWKEVWGRMNKEDIQGLVEQLQNSIDDLEKIDQLIAGIYAAKSGRDAADYRPVMDKGGWLNAEEAKELGLVDEIVDEGAAPVLNSSAQMRLTACALPIPSAKMVALPEEPAAPTATATAEIDATPDLSPSEKKGFWARLREELGLSPEKHQKPTNMNEQEKTEVVNTATPENPPAAAAAAPEAPAAENKTPDLAAIAARLEALEAENKTLKEQVEAFNKADGAETNDADPNAGAEGEEYEGLQNQYAREFMNKHGHLI